ncbi:MULTISPECIES: PTS sugar transporter subunit IIB [unclassified Candidatus Frackibacter]|uniref:PTS sugar transporter subunit IIB n=1 Tax=unclassified Candidatus Frackibacter TaxID=2648818 RepID=UPI000882CE6F|nr:MULTISPECIES: PTS sugar transporter subunit IIB [unclassified Candidatus Frackibacter]SDC54846.1 PTS system, cellobiose-specific IIB component [Candidatus Frackibacter sp. WG11]SEM66968.1 PTS system, cellobiose-specific IIB component [Candidatus Frackibacter sp. WG12]SFL78254.1 PTS system, cellobiose-specific IIB component [Candidatus Frackibacter sp. WG13]
MNNVNILLVCSFGMSTSLLVRTMKEAADERRLNVEVKSVGSSQLNEEADDIDVVLLGPQVRYMQEKVEELGKPVKVIDSMTYAVADGDQALDEALSLID